MDQAEKIGELRWIERLGDVQNGEIDEIFNFIRRGFFRTLLFLPLRWQRRIGFYL
jgi:hypothetical protein